MKYSGAGNSFLGGLGAGLALTGGDVVQGAWHGSYRPVAMFDNEGILNRQRHSTRRYRPRSPSNNKGFLA